MMRLHLILICITTACLAFEEPYGGTLVFGRGADSVTLDPGRVDDGESGKVVGQIYDTLVRHLPDSTAVEPALALSWRVSSNSLQWTFQLRRDVVFHDGTAFDAAAVVFSFRRLFDAKHPYFFASPQKNLIFANVLSVDAVGSHQVRVTLTRPFAPFLNNMAMVGASIVSPEAVKTSGDQFSKHPVGTGGFVFESWEKRRITLKAFSSCWEGRPYLDELVFESQPDNNKRFLEFKAGLIQVMDGINPIDVRRVQMMTRGKILLQAGMNVGYLAMHNEKPPFDQVKVRRAINMAINRERLVKLHYRGFAIVARNPIPPSMWSHHDAVSQYPYEPQQAMDLLAEAGLGDGFDVSLWISNVPRPYMPQPAAIARSIKNDLKKINVNVTIEEFSWETHLDNIDNGYHTMCLSGWIADNGDPDNFLYVLFDKDNAVPPNASNTAFIKDEDLHQVLIKAQRSPDKAERTRMYHRVQEMIHDRAPWVPLAHAQQIYAFQPKVKGLILHPTGISRFHKVWLD